MSKNNGKGIVEAISDSQLANLYDFLTYNGKDKRSPRMILIADALGDSAKVMPVMEGFYQTRMSECSRYEDATFKESCVYFTHGNSNRILQKSHIFSLLIEGVENGLMPLMSYLGRVFAKNFQQIKNKFSTRAERNTQFLSFIEVNQIDIFNTQIGILEVAYLSGRDHVEQSVMQKNLKDVASLMVSIFFDFLMSETTEIKHALDDLIPSEQLAHALYTSENRLRSNEVSDFNLRIRSEQEKKVMRQASRLFFKQNLTVDYHAKYETSSGIWLKELDKDSLTFSQLNELLGLAALRSGITLPALGDSSNRKELRDNLSFYFEVAKNPVDFLTSQPSVEGMSYAYFGEVLERTFSELKELRTKTLHQMEQTEEAISRSEDLSRLEEENLTLRQERTELQTKLFSLDSVKSQLQEEKSKSKEMQAEIKRLTSLLEHSSSQNAESQDEASEESQVDSLEQTIPYEELQNIMRDMRIVIVGGHVNWQNKLSRVLPNIRFKDQSTFLDVEAIRNSDVVCFNTSFMQHKAFYETQEALRLRDVPVVFLDKTNVELTMRQIYEGYLKLKV